MLWRLCVLLLLSARLEAADSYRVVSTEILEIDEWGECRLVANGAGRDLFVPTRTASEWSQFRSNLPAGVSLFPCINWYDNAWLHRIPIEIEASRVSGSQTNFPILVTGDLLPAHFWSTVKADGTDILVTAADGITALPRTLVSINTGTSQLQMHVRLPSVSSSVNTLIYVYYGNAAASETNSTTTWSQYRNVYHMEVTMPPDSRGANNTNSTTGATVVAGRVGSGLDFSGSGRINFTTTVSATNLRTVSFWYYPRGRGGGNFGTVLGSADYNNGIRHLDTDSLRLRRGGASLLGSSNTFNVWKHLAFVYNSGTGQVEVFENGVSGGTAGFASGWYAIPHLIGVAADATRAPNGIVDEVRISDQILTSGWLLTEFNNQSNPVTFFSVGAREDRP